MSARMSRRVTAESRARAARTMFPRFTDEQGSSANSPEALFIRSPAWGHSRGCLQHHTASHQPLERFVSQPESLKQNLCDIRLTANAACGYPWVQLPHGIGAQGFVQGGRAGKPHFGPYFHLYRCFSMPEFSREVNSACLCRAVVISQAPMLSKSEQKLWFVCV